MQKKFLSLLLMVAVLVFFVAGCGQQKPKESADKAVVAWADLLFSGETENPEKIGVEKADMDEYHSIAHDYYIKQFDLEKFHLSADTQDEVATHLINEYNDKIHLTAKIKKDDDKNPVVTLSYTPLDIGALKKDMAADPAIAELFQAVQALNATGVNGQQIDGWDADASQRLINAFTDLPVQGEKTIDVTCDLVEKDGQTLWIPKKDDLLKVQKALLPET